MPPENSQPLNRSIQEGIDAAALALEHIRPSVLLDPALGQLLEESSNPLAREVMDNLLEAHALACQARARIAAGIGELTAYVATVNGTGEGTASTSEITPGPADISVSGSIPVSPEQSGPDTTPQPEYTLDFSEDEVKALIPDISTFTAIKKDRIYEIPGHPDKILRVIPLKKCMVNTFDMAATITIEKAREHMRTYETELTRLQQAGIPILRRTTHIACNKAGEPLLYTVVERHAADIDLFTLSKRVSPNIPEGSLYDHRHTVRRTMSALTAYRRGSAGKRIDDIEVLRQYAIDGVLLDYDPYLLQGMQAQTVPALIGDWEKYIQKPPMKIALRTKNEHTYQIPFVAHRA